MGDLLATPAEAAAGLAVYGAGRVDGDAPASIRRALVDSGVPDRLVARDPTLWASEAAGPGWVDTHHRGRELLPQLAELTAELADLDHVVLVGVGGSALAAEVVARTTGRPLTVLDSTDPGQVRAALHDRLDRTVVVVAGHGATVETDSIRRAYRQAFLAAGMTEAEAGRHFVVVTDPGSPLEAVAAETDAITVPAVAEVDDRYSALSAFALVPCALAGVAVTDLLDQAEAFSASLGRAADNPGLALGAALAAAATTGRDKVALLADGTGVEGLGDWVEQLLAGSTGKDGLGILPVVVEAPDSPGLTGPDVLTVSYGGALAAGGVPGPGTTAPDLAVNGPLGAHFLAWAYATAVAATTLGVNPFGQPDVAETTENTTAILTEGVPATPPSSVAGAIEVYAPPSAPADLVGALRHLLDGIGDDGYLAVTAYLDRHADATAARLRELLARATDRPVTFGWGPRYLHSTGQYHKGGPQVGSFLQVTGTVDVDLPVPGQPYSFGELQAAQAAGDRRALARRERPLLRLHLTERSAGLAQLLDTVGSLRA